MSKIMFVLRPSPQVKTFSQNVVKRFKLLQGVDLQLMDSHNLIEVASQIESGRVAIIFNESRMQKTEVNLLTQCIAKSKQKPYLILDDTNYNFFAGSDVIAQQKVPLDRMGKATADFSESFMFSCVRNLLSPPGQKLDIRYIRSLVNSVVDVINANTQCQMQAQKISEIKAKEEPEEIAIVSAFYGDGFLGSIKIGTTYSLLSLFTQKMLYCEESDVSSEMISDLAAEISNQILGAVRNSLSEFGWKLKSSMQVVSSASELLNNSASNGRYYNLPFEFEGKKFNLSFCYNTYQTSIKEIEEVAEEQRLSKLDVRLMRHFEESSTKMLEANLADAITLGSIKKQNNSLFKADSIHLFHATSWQGNITIGLEVPRAMSEAIMAKTMGMTPDAVDDSTVNDYWGEILNQIGGEFLKKAKTSQYSFQRIYLGEFSGKEIDIAIKSPGLNFKYDFRSGDHEAFVYFGCDSSFVDPFYDAWPYIRKNQGLEESA
jgi:CheY-specific phosphatase CheX